MSTAGGYPNGKRREVFPWRSFCFALMGLIVGGGLVYAWYPKAEAKIDEAKLREIVHEHLGKEYPSTERLLEIVRDEVEGERRKRIEWERKLIAWGETIQCRCSRRGSPGVPGAVGAAPEVPPPATDE